MPDLREQLQHCFQGRVCLMGLGNLDYGDDGFGVRLAEALAGMERQAGGAGFCGSGESDVAFPLTPALSLREREPRRQVLREVEARGLVARRDTILRLPKGEGRGEGERGFETGRRPRRHSPNRRAVSPRLPYSVINAGTIVERFIGQVADGSFDHVIFLDAVEFGGAPGSVVLLDSNEMAARFPQVSTHKLSLGLLARQIEASGHSKAWLLGVQPESLRQGEQLSPTVQATLELLLELLREKHTEVMA